MQNIKDLQKNNVIGIIWLHAVIIALIWTSPFLFSWYIIFLGALAYYLQIIILGDCILTRRQFNVPRRSITFYDYLLSKIGIKTKRLRIRFIADYILPWIILGTALLWQIVLDHPPLLI
ncbi:MAG: hypothetical protein WC505_02435 [Patescibacteria group bacterium]